MVQAGVRIGKAFFFLLVLLMEQGTPRGQDVCTCRIGAARLSDGWVESWEAVQELICDVDFP